MQGNECWLEYHIPYLSYSLSFQLARSSSSNDSFHETISSTCKNYLNLASSLLVLGYGGYLVLTSSTSSTSTSKPLQSGDLITFQLYWSMIKGAFQAIINILNQFTK